MPKKNWLKTIQLTIQAPGHGFSLMDLALKQVQVAINKYSETCLYWTNF